MIDSKHTDARVVEFTQLIEAAKTYLMFRQEITPSDPGISETSIAIVKSWKPRTRTANTLNHNILDHKVLACPGRMGSSTDLFIVTQELQKGVSPYEGDAGKLFLKILGAIDLTLDDVYITAVNNSGPLPAILESIKRQVNKVKPVIICTLGRRAAQAMLGQKIPLEQLRGRFHDFNGIPLMPTFHPAALIDDQSKKRPVWEDMKMIKSMLEQKGQPNPQKVSQVTAPSTSGEGLGN